jgi:hypothetical protein
MAAFNEFYTSKFGKHSADESTFNKWVNKIYSTADEIDEKTYASVLYDILRVELPYCIHYSEKDKKYYYLNRLYKGLGVKTANYVDYPKLSVVMEQYLYLDLYEQCPIHEPFDYSVIEAYYDKWQLFIDKAEKNKWELIKV